MRLILYVIFVFTNDLFGQFAQLSPAVQPEMAWRGGDVILSGKNSFTLLKSDNSSSVTIPLPPNTVDNRYAQNYFWILQEDDTLEHLTIKRSSDGFKWEFVGSWTKDEGAKGAAGKSRFYLHPIAENAFLLVVRAGGEWFNVEGKLHPVVIAKINEKKELKVFRVVDLELKEKLAWIKEGKFVFNQHYVWFMSSIINRPFLTVNDKVFLAFRRIGLFVEIKPNGSIGKKIQVIPALDETTAMDPNNYDWAILCSQPTKEGEILMLARTPDGVMEGRKRFPRNYLSPAANDAGKQQDSDMSELAALRAHPFMDWWKVNTEDGQIYPAAAPAKVPAIFGSIDEFRKFVFHYNAAGNLVFPLLNN